ncbi:MAG: Flp family type IVb pilin [Rhodospirillales bacterium]|nr:Flp family type IVb pilin [Rhodospirillales bacterium]
MLPRLPSVFCRLVRNQGGVTMVEYALLAALLSLATVATLNSVGQAIQSVMSAATSGMN